MINTGLRLFEISSVIPIFYLFYPTLFASYHNTTKASVFDSLSKFGRPSHINLKETLYLRELAPLPRANSRAASLISLDPDPIAC